MGANIPNIVSPITGEEEARPSLGYTFPMDEENLRRWVVERSFAWIGHNRRMSKDYEKLCATSEAFVYAAMSRLMLRRLART